jgi:hypothetical protein
MVLHDSEENEVAFAEIAATPGLGDEVDPLGRVADEGALVRRGGVDEGGDEVTRLLVFAGCQF